MKSKIPALVSSLVVGLAAVSTASAAQAADTEKKAVSAATAEFYAALNQMFVGDLESMKTVWSHAADVTYMGPGGGFKIGWEQVLKDWEAQAALKLGGKVQAVDMHVTVGRDLAIVSNVENGENTNAKGQVQKLSIRATNLFRKEGGKWKMIGHHTDLLPYLEK